MKQRLLAFFTGVTLLCNTVLTASPVLAKSEENKEAPKGNTYYVSTIDGKDSNSGLSDNQALYSLKALSKKNLGPGDHVYLERGSQFNNDYLHLYEVSGSEDAPIVIDAYGEGALPVINTNGEGVWFQNYGKSLDNPNHRSSGYVSSSILLYDCAYIEVQNIAMTNRQLDIDAVYNDIDAMNRTGVAVVAQNKGTLNHIYLKNLDVQDVEGNVYDKHMNNGGIYFTAFVPKNEQETGIARYNDVLIDGCYVKNVNRWGIAMAYTAYFDHFRAAEISDEDIAKYGATNVRISNNYVKDPGGDAITTMYCDRPIVEYNVADGAARQINNTDYSATSFGRVAASVWPWKCKNAVFQYNEVFNTRFHNGQNADGQAFDADYGDGTIYQYNYSHDNEGGALMICLYDAVNTVFRYNISQNDDRAALVPATSPLTKVYNNTFYMKEGVPFIATNSGSYGQLELKNNIIYYAGSSPRQENWQAATTTYSNNLFYNYANTPSNSVNHITADPLMTNPGQGGTGSENGPALDTLKGYMLQDGSPAIAAGTPIADNGGQDFFGNEVKGIPSIGAHHKTISDDKLELSSTKYTLDKENHLIIGVNWDSVQTFMENLIYGESWTIELKDENGKSVELDSTQPVKGGYTFTYQKNAQSEKVTYTVAKSDKAEFETTFFEQEDSVLRVPLPLSTEQLLSGIQPSLGATMELLNNGKLVKEDNVEEGMTLKVTAEDEKTTKEYTIEKKNSYVYFDDLISGVAAGKQGNIWFVQEHMSDGSYQNMTNYRADWKGWDGNDTTNWHFVGCNSGANPTSIKIVDRLVDRTNKGHAIGFRAPVDGSIQLTAIDGLKLLSANNSGEVWVSVLKNDQPIMEQTQLDNSAQTSIEVDYTIDVKRGDIIRVEVQNKGAGVAQGGVQANVKAEYTAIAEPTPTPEPTSTPEPTATPNPTATPKPTSTPEPTTTPKPTTSPEPTITPNPTATPSPTATPQPTATPNPGVVTNTTVASELKEVPASLAQIPELNTVAKIQAKMETTAKAVVGDLQQFSLWDYRLMATMSDGTQQEVTPENFPKEGVVITLDFPQSTSDKDTFVVTHMFTTEQGSHKVGDVETIIPTVTKDGISFRVYSLSPIGLSWKSSSSQSTGDNNQGNNNQNNQNQTPSTPSGNTSTSPQTGDSATAYTMLFACLSVAGLSGGMVYRRKYNK